MNHSPNTTSAHHAATAPVDAHSSLLRMAVGDQDLAVPIDDVREILEVGRLTALPRTPDFVRGVMNLRGAVVPVIDLAARVGQPPIVIGRRSCVVVVEAEPPAHADDTHDAAADAESASDSPHGDHVALVVGLLVDAVFEVFDAPASGIEPVPALGTRIAAEFLRGMTRARGEVIGVLALDRVLAQQELSALIANHVPH
jgi:purine-binding chemotaxis protein CheW